MLLDARSLPAGHSLDADVCIIGAGAAGIALAREFIDRPFQVCLLESGGLDFEPSTQALYEGENVGLPYFPLDTSRLRFFGGTTNHWDGDCWPLESIDFEQRDWVPYSGWPLSRAQLDPYYERAQVVCELGPFRYDTEFWARPGRLRPLPLAGTRVRTKTLQKSPPTRFGSRYRRQLAAAATLKTILHANVVQIDTNEAGRTVTRVQAATLAGNRFTVTARIFIVAAGGIENARLLLLSNQRQARGIGNQHDLVGRFFMEHLVTGTGQLLPGDPFLPFAFYGPHAVNGVRVQGALGFRPRVLRAARTLNGVYFFARRVRLDESAQDQRAIESLDILRHALRSREIPDNFVAHLANVLGDLDFFAARAYQRIRGGRRRGVKLITMDSLLEQAPNPDSRVTLTRERDALGCHRAALDWRLTDLDRKTIELLPRVLAGALGQAALGRVRLDPSPWDERATPTAAGSAPSGISGAWHHMGTTRMHEDPKQGVVDANCRVHGLSNLYVAGSSVFPTCGYANPTLTLVALALRLADHIEQRMR